MKPDKIFECSCADGFTGDFCEFKTEQDHLLYLNTESTIDYKLNIQGPIQFIYNAAERLIEESAVIDDQAIVYQSCSTMLNGEALIFGGYGIQGYDALRQVISNLTLISIHYGL